jgi:hypothetical protein
MLGNNVTFYKTTFIKFPLLINYGIFRLLVIFWKPNKLKYYISLETFILAL